MACRYIIEERLAIPPHAINQARPDAMYLHAKDKNAFGSAKALPLAARRHALRFRARPPRPVDSG